MPLARRTNAKYGAKIPVAPSTGAKQPQAARQGGVARPSATVQQAPKKGGDKKR